MLNPLIDDAARTGNVLKLRKTPPPADLNRWAQDVADINRALKQAVPSGGGTVGKCSPSASMNDAMFSSASSTLPPVRSRHCSSGSASGPTSSTSRRVRSVVHRSFSFGSACSSPSSVSAAAAPARDCGKGRARSRVRAR